MAAALDHALDHLRKLLAAENASQWTDGQLLQRFAGGRDEVAFAALVHRHGAMVLNVCRRVLANDADAEDACQATFLVLARRARSIRNRDSVASWLHGVAYRAASTLRRQIIRRRDRDRAATPLPEPDPVAEVTWREVQTILDEEIARLPEKFKGPVLLCFLEGMAHNEGAERLGWSLTTFRGRLDRARELLRQALSRRGVTLSAALLAAVLAEKGAAAALSPQLMIATVRAALAGEAAVPGVLSMPVLTLAQEVMQAMTSSKWTLGVAALLLAVVTFGIGGFALHGLAGGGIAQAPGGQAKDRDVGNKPGEAQDAPKGAAKIQARLPDGAIIELVGVGQHPSEGKAWWQADGTPLPEAVDDTSKLKEPYFDGQYLRELAIQVRKPAAASADVMSQPFIGGMTATSGTNESLRIRQSLSIPRATREMTVKIGYAAGDWKAVAVADSKGVTKSKDIRFAAIERRPDGRALVRIEHSLRDDERQIVAYDRAGKRHISFPNSRQHTGPAVLKDEGQFDLAIDDIQRIVLEVRRYTWVEFRRVSLHPGKKTEVEVVIDPRPKEEMIDPEVLAKLATQLRSKDHEVRSATLAALAKLLLGNKDSKTDLTRLVEPLFALAGWGGNARDNARSAEALIVRIGAQATPLLRQRLKSADAHDRRVAAELLVRIGPPDASLVALLRPLLEDRDDYVRKAAIDGLGTVGAPAREAVADLERVAKNDPLLPRQVAARLALIRITGSSAERVRALAAFLVLKEPCDGAAVYAAACLGDLGPQARAAEPELLAALKHAEAGVRVNAAHALGKIGTKSPDVVRALIDLLKNDPETEARRSAAASLGEFGATAKPAIPALRAALKGDAKESWWVAADALGKIGGAEVVPALIEAVTNPDENIRRTAMKGLGELGAVARPAIPALEKARQADPRDFNRTAAAAALRKIEQAIRDAAKDQEALADPNDAIEALEKLHYRLFRDQSGLVVQARLAARPGRLDDAIPHLRRLPKLAWLALDEDSLSTESFRQLAAMRSLDEIELNAIKKCPAMPWQDLRFVRCVRLSGKGVDDDLLKAVSAMPAVTSLHLNGVAVSADGLAHLQRLDKLESVLIQSSKVSAEGVRRLGEVEKLRSLTLAGNDIGHAGFAHVGTLIRLEYLNLESTRCTDDDVKALTPLANLADLDLGYNPAVTDAGVRHLAELKKLSGLRLYGTKVTDAGVAELKKARPTLTVGK